MSTPVIITISPDNGLIIGSQTVSIEGSNLTDVTSVLFGLTSVSVTPSSSTLVTFDTPPTSTTGAVSVVCINSSTTWSKITNADISGIEFQTVSVSLLTGQYQLAGVLNGGLYMSSDYGTTWTLNMSASLPTIGNWKSVAVSDDGTYLTALNANTGIFVSSDSGVSWTKLGSNLNYSSVSITGDGRVQSVAVYFDANVYVSTDYGVSFQSHTTGGASDWLSISIDSVSGKYQTIVSSSRRFVSANYGASWNGVVSSSFYYTCIAMDSTGHKRTATTNTGIWYSWNSGSSWVTPSLDFVTTGGWNSIAMDSTGQYQTAVSASSASICYSTDYGENWSLYSASFTPNPNFQSVSMGGTNGLYKSTAGSGGIFILGARSNSLTYTYNYIYDPIINSVSPSYGSTTGGQTITITGTNLSGATVTIGGISVTPSSASSTQIICTTPVGSFGTSSVIVSVTGAASATETYTYIYDPIINSIYPSSGSTTGGQPITITGQHLSGATVTIGATAAGERGRLRTSSVTPSSVSSTQIIYTTPAGVAGPATIIVSVPGTTSATGTYTYIYDPIINSISPSSGPTTGGQTITITGTNLSGATVTIGGTSVTPSSASSTQIICTTSAGSAGPASVIVSVTGTTSATGTYTYNETVILFATGTASATGTYTLNETVISDICFPIGTPVTTDQGHIPIEQINPDIHTIHNNQIIAITKTITQDTYLVCFEKHSLGFNKPNKKTITSKHHKVYYNGVMIQAQHFLKRFKHVSKIEYNGEILYNVLMEKYDKLKVNNLIFETLHPENIIAKLYTSWFDDEYKNKIIGMINYSIMHNDHCLYQNIINRIVHDKKLSTCVSTRI